MNIYINNITIILIHYKYIKDELKEDLNYFFIILLNIAFIKVPRQILVIKYNFHF